MAKLSKKERKRLKKLRKQQGQVRKLKLINAPSLRMIIKNNILFIGALILVCFGLYYNSLNNEITLVDDFQGIILNERIKDLPASLKGMNIQIIVYALSYRFWGDNPMPLRIVSVSLHTAVTVLAFLFVYKLYGRKIAIFSSLIFAVHPINTEAVTWISGSPYLYLALFSFLVLHFYLTYKQTNNNKYIYLALIFYIATMVFVRSPWILVIPFVMVILDQIVIEQEFDFSKLWWVFLFSIPVSIYLFTWFGKAYETRIAVRMEGGRRATMNTQSFTPVIQGYPYTTYLMSVLYLFPYNLSIYYDGMPVTTLLFIGMYLTFFIYVGLVIYFWKKRKEIGGILLVLPALIAPTYSPVKVTWFLAERYLYTGTVFFSVLVSIFLIDLGRKYQNKYIPIGILFVILSLFSVKTYIRNNQWQNTETLAFATMKTSPLSVRPYNDVGGYYYYRGDIKKAIEYYEKGLEVVPTSGTAINNLGFIYFDYGPLLFWDDFKPSEQNDEYAQLLFDNAKVHIEEQSDPKTVSYFLNKALAYNSESVEIATATADFYFNLKLYDYARKLYAHVLKIDPSNDYAAKKIQMLID